MTESAAIRYGVNETNNLADTGIPHSDTDHSFTYQLSDKRVVKIIRIRLLGDTGWDSFPFYDLSYVIGQLADGTQVPVNFERHQFAKGLWKSQLVQEFKDAKRFQRHLFDVVSLLK